MEDAAAGQGRAGPASGSTRIPSTRARTAGWGTRRRWLRSGTALAGAVLAAACGQAAGGPGGGPAPGSAPVALLYWSQRAPGDRLGNGVKAALDDYVARNPDRVTLEVGEQGAALNMEKIKAAIAGGTQPDLYGGLYQGPAVELFTLGAVLDLNSELRNNRDWTKSKGELIPSNLDGCSWKGKFVMLPMMLAQQVLGINKQIMLRAGVALPVQGFTWSDFVEMGRKVVQPGERWLMAWNYTWSAFNSWIYANGLTPLSSDRTKVLYDTPQMLETLQWLHDQATATQLFRPGPAAIPDFDGGKLAAESVNEAAAMQPPRYPNVDSGAGEGLFVTHFPFGPSNVRKQIITYANTYGLIALKSSDLKRVAAAAEVAGWGARSDVQMKIADASGHPPPNLVAAREDNLPARIKSNPILNKINEFGKYTYLTPNFPSWTRGMEILTENFMRVMQGELRPKDALADAQPKIQALVDEDLKRA